ncbi:unnamed protein product [Nippostrongylus brasiliensis]|uniref:Transposase n=1 Tax=Nippostrongylus brasiliensis TaxID=27835 RepID=A0A0N4XGD5_NIPBR|nr:unnamed protein product [Nippostrongylus brasiliensis]
METVIHVVAAPDDDPLGPMVPEAPAGQISRQLSRVEDVVRAIPRIERLLENKQMNGKASNISEAIL